LMGRRSDTVSLDTLGCKLNKAESDSLGRSLADIGCELVTPDDNPGVYILNTCTVTHVADRKSRHLLRLARRRNPNCLIVATGCYAERAPQELERMTEVDLVIGNGDKVRLPDMLKQQMQGDGPGARHPRLRRTRSFIEVQQGCNQFCSYCIVPYVRGRECSREADEVVNDVRRAADEGYREVVLTGTRIGSYRGGLGSLIQRVLDETEVQRLRLSSLQAPEITPDLLGLWQDSRLCRHFHIPLQSGSDTVLQRMERRYTAADYRLAVCQIRERIPDVAITTDIMVGFPGETPEEFAECYRFCEQTAFAGMHVFQYSARPGTRAAHMGVTIADNIRKERSEAMLRLAKITSYNFRSRYISRYIDVLWEQRSSGSLWSGLTDNYIKAITQSDEHLANRCLPAKVSACSADYVTAELVL